MVERADIQKFADAIVARFPVEKIILFGSSAYGSPNQDSDVDLLVVMNYEGSGVKKSVDVLGAAPRNFPCDLIVIRPGELAKRYCEFNPLIGDAVDKGVILYERRSAEVA